MQLSWSLFIVTIGLPSECLDWLQWRIQFYGNISKVYRVFQWAEQFIFSFVHSKICKIWMNLKKTLCKYICQQFCGVLANIMDQIASKTSRIRAHILASKKKNPTFLIWPTGLNVVPKKRKRKRKKKERKKERKCSTFRS